MIPVRTVSWKRSWRVIQDRYPRVDIYERLADPKEWGALQQLEEMTNPRLRQQKGEINVLRPEDRFPEGKSSYNVAAAFTHSGQSRFGDGSFGVYYTAKALSTAIAEKIHNVTVFLSATRESSMSLRMRVLISEIQGQFHDLRSLQKKHPDLYSLRSYTASRRFGRQRWQEGSQGIVYDSVRHPSGECAAVFKPQTIRHCRQERCLQFEWDGKEVRKVYELQEYPR